MIGARSFFASGVHMNEHVKPTLGERPLQELQVVEIDKFYTNLKDQGFALDEAAEAHAQYPAVGQGWPVHEVAARIGDDAAILLRVYAKLTKKKNDKMSEVLNALGTLILGQA